MLMSLPSKPIDYFISNNHLYLSNLMVEKRRQPFIPEVIVKIQGGGGVEGVFFFLLILENLTT